MGGLCARSWANGATRNSTRAAQIGRMAHGLTSQHALNDHFCPDFGEFFGIDGRNTLARSADSLFHRSLVI